MKRQGLYKGQAVEVPADGGPEGREVRFSRKDLEVIDVYETHLVAEALDGKQYTMSIEEWERGIK